VELASNAKHATWNDGEWNSQDWNHGWNRASHFFFIATAAGATTVVLDPIRMNIYHDPWPLFFRDLEGPSYPLTSWAYCSTQKNPGVGKGAGRSTNRRGHVPVRRTQQSTPLSRRLAAAVLRLRKGNPRHVHGKNTSPWSTARDGPVPIPSPPGRKKEKGWCRTQLV
jgi:hypothetical protein